MAKTKKKKFDKDALTASISRMVKNSAGYASKNLDTRNVKSFDLYNRVSLPGDINPETGKPYKTNRSRYISPDVMERVDWSVASTIRVFDSTAKAVEFHENGPEDAALAKQQTDVVNFIVRAKNSHVASLYPWLKNGFITGLGITMVSFDVCREELPVEILTGVPEEQLAQLEADEKADKIVIEEIGEAYEAEVPAAAPMLPGAPPQLAALLQQIAPKPQLHDVKIRRIKNQRHMNIVNLAPEDFIVSKDADFDQQTGGIKAALQGHKRIMARADLLAMKDLDAETVNSIPSADDTANSITQARQSVVEGSEGTGDVNDDVTVYEIYTKIAIDDNTRRHYRVTLAGDLENNPVYLRHTEVSKYYPYAAFCPYPTANTLFGHGIADRVGDEQILLSRLRRQEVDNLHMANNPIKIVNENDTNINDLLNLGPGRVIRSRAPDGGVKWITPPVTAGTATAITADIKQTMDFITGVGGGMMAVNATDFQDTTATGVSARANSSQLFIELICRWFADTGYRYLFKIIVDLLVSNPEDAAEYIKRVTNNFVPIQVDAFDPDFDVTATVAFGVMNKDGNNMILNNVLDRLLMAKQAGMPFAQDTNIAHALTKILENNGIKDIASFITPQDKWPEPPQQVPPPDPNSAMIEQMKIQGEIDMGIAKQKQDFEAQKLIWENDLKRDQMAQDLAIAMAEIKAKYGAQVDMARLEMEQARQRNDIDYAIAQHTNQTEALTTHAKNMAEIEAKQAEEQQKQQAALQQAAQETMQQEQPEPPQMPPQMPPQSDEEQK